MKVYIVAKNKDSVYESVAKKLNKLGVTETENLSDCNIVITIGGDGTILRAGKSAARENKPLLGINTGRLGFMATLEKDGLDEHKLERLTAGDYATSRRMILDVWVGGKDFQALNDVVLHRGNKPRLPEFAVLRDLRGNGSEIIRIRADGMIISTPTGSTAYSLSAGGPIIEPELECFLLTALSPHTLFNRPMLFSPDIKLSIISEDVYVNVDGEDVDELSGDNNSVTVTRSGYYLDLIDIDGNNFYDSIHNKLVKPLK